MLLQIDAGRNFEKTNCEKTNVRKRKNQELFVRQHARPISCSTTCTVPWRNSLLWDSPREVSPCRLCFDTAMANSPRCQPGSHGCRQGKCSLRFLATRADQKRLGAD